MEKEPKSIPEEEEPELPKVEGYIERSFDEEVLIRIKPKGEEIYRQQLENIGAPIRELKRDENGYIKMQLWEIMQIFGSSMHIGMVDTIDLGFQMEEKPFWKKPPYSNLHKE